MENIIISIIQMSQSPVSVSITTYEDVKNTLTRLKQERQAYYQTYYDDYNKFKQFTTEQQDVIKRNLREMKTEILSTQSYLRIFRDDSDEDY